ncbi:PAS domain S-box-containing protein/diguanylate cyclase (GGDEF)-like protein [Crenobacter luteus]|uniref:sensor domain-containing protein n=1 Tax=Crenobacter luteus TaxID=1452487 RepID=UPI0010F19A58|nr:EAL domain-containing protein [Crenobacter luteus]TCP15526.1 PAS domain S-box-containing protein/diguanylate cyclase (GGDEF)-like protein [Crenobacter luteus]
MNENKAWLCGLGLAAYLAALAIWPAPFGAAYPASQVLHTHFLALGVLALSALRLPSAWVSCWPLAGGLAALALGQGAGALWVVLTGFATVGGLRLAGIRRGRSWFESPRELAGLIARLALYPATLVALLLGGVALSVAGGGEALARGLLVWGAAGLALTVCVALGLARAPGRRTRFELALLAVAQLLLWALLKADTHHAYSLPMQVLLFPVVLWGAFRAGVMGAAALSLVAIVLPDVHPAAGAFEPRLTTLALNLAFGAAALTVAVLVEGFQRSEAELRAFRARFESLLDHSPNLMTIRSLDGRFLMANRAFAQLFGLAVPQVMDKTLDELFLPHEAAKVREHEAEVSACLEPRQYEEVYTVDGAPRVLLTTRFPLFGADGRLAGLGSIATDVSDTKWEEQARREAEEKYRALVEQSLVGIFILQDDRLVYANPKLAEMLGYPVAELENMPIERLVGPFELALLKKRDPRRVRNLGGNLLASCRAIRRDGGLVDVEMHSRRFEYCGARATIGVVVDVSDRVAADAELQLAAKVFENSAEGILITDADANIIAVNAAFTRITGYEADEAIGRVSRMFRDWGSEQNIAMLHDLQTIGHWHGEMIDRRKSGERYPAELSISTVRDASGLLTHFVAVFSDITARKQSEDRLQFLATHDPLTGLPNRAGLIARVDEAIFRAAGGADGPALMFIDLDRFKLINDSFGHQAGDETLRETTARLIRITERRGFLARLGGDEFTLLVEGGGEERLAELADEIIATLSQPLMIQGHEVFVTGSIGISVFPNDGTDAQTLLKNADVAMYRAKEAGKNTYQFFAAEMNSQTFERLLMENGLRMALERDEFELHYQPLLDAQTHAVAAVEVLIRWRHPQLGLVPPNRFIPLAEETGLIRNIGHWVLESACRQLKDWDRAGLRVPRVAVNLSARQFEQATLVQQVREVLTSAELSADRLELEITESTLMKNPVEAAAFLYELKDLGVKLAIDDFGTGYSSLSYLMRFPLDTLKIDRSFVDGLPEDDDSLTIIEAILAMAKKRGFEVVAEGVETESQSRFLSGKGCSLLQGYLFCRPLPAADFERFARAWQGRASLYEPLMLA